MIKLFKRKKKTDERTPQLTTYDRRALEIAGFSNGRLPASAVSQMTRDGMVQTALTIKSLAVLSADWTLVARDDSPRARRAAEFVQSNFEQMEGSPSTILSGAMEAFATGWSVQELVYFRDKGGIQLASVNPKDPQFFGLDVDQFGNIKRLNLLIPGLPQRALPRAKFAVYVNRRSYAHPKGQSDLEAAHGNWKSKQTLLKAWNVHLEKFAMPTVLGRYENGVPSEEQASILSALQDLQNNTAIVYPSEIDISTLGGDKTPSTGFQEAIEFHNREIARAILGQTLKTDEGRRVGSLALGKVHLQVMLLQINAIRRELADTVMNEQVIRPLVEMNFGPGVAPKFEFDETGADVFANGKLS